MKRVTALVISLIVRTWDVLVAVAASRSNAERATAVVLYYHAVTPDQRHRFARQMDELIKRTKPISLGCLEAIPMASSAAVTFDDGFRCVVENAVPELEKRGIPFACFVPSGCLGRRPSWVHDAHHPSWTERVLSPEELEALALRPLATLGSHSVTHQNMLTLDAAAAETEFAVSKACLESVINGRIDWFSFPHGAHNDALLTGARRAGYRKVFTIEPDLAGVGEAFAVGRVAVDPSDWLLEFKLKIAGAYRWKRLMGRWRLAA